MRAQGLELSAPCVQLECALEGSVLSGARRMNGLVLELPVAAQGCLAFRPPMGRSSAAHSQHVEKIISNIYENEVNESSDLFSLFCPDIIRSEFDIAFRHFPVLWTLAESGGCCRTNGRMHAAHSACMADFCA